MSANTDFWTNKKIIVTGGSGFIGSHLSEMLINLGGQVTVLGITPLSNLPFSSSIINQIDYHKIDLTKLTPKLIRLFSDHDVVFHLAARVAGIGYNVDHPATMLRDNVAMTLAVFEASRQNKIPYIQFVSSACVYPHICAIPTPETEGFIDEPEPTNYGYGWAKRMGEIIAKTYAQEHHLKVSIVRPYNAYGPRDNFDPATSHVIPALIRRIMDGENPVIVWGDGSPTRSFLYVEDLVKGMIKALEKYPIPDPINIGTSEEISIKDLVKLILSLTNSQAKINFDTTKPNGQPRRNCDTTKAKKKISFSAGIALEQGLKQTIDWYKQNFRYQLI